MTGKCGAGEVAKSAVQPYTPKREPLRWQGLVKPQSPPVVTDLFLQGHTS